MNGATVGLIIISLITVIVIIGIGPYIKKVSNCYYFWISIGVLLFIYMCVGRFGNDWKNLNQYFKNNIHDDFNHNILVSKGLLLDICPFTCFLLLLSIIFDPTRKVARVISPFALFGGLITIFGLNTNDIPKFNAHWIFLGNHPNEMYFMMHYIMVIVGTLVLVSTPRFNTYGIFKKKIICQKLDITCWLFCIIYAILYYSYVAILMKSLNVTDHVSGLNINDWDPSYGNAEYSGVAISLNCSPQVAAALGFITSFITISLLIFAFGSLQEIKKYHWDNIWNKKCWWCKQTYIKHVVTKQNKPSDNTNL